MAAQLVCLIRHGETAWTLTGQHTGLTDLPLTAHGEATARQLAPVLSSETFGLVLTSPLQRARRTCELAGLSANARIDPDLTEWNYGEYEGLTPRQIREHVPGWMIFAEGCPGGERPEDVAARVDRVIARVRASRSHVALFAHGHVFRVFVARWLGLPPFEGSRFMLDTASLSVLSDYHSIPAVKRWNAVLAPASFHRRLRRSTGARDAAARPGGLVEAGERFMTTNLETTAQALVADGKGILAADETPSTLTKRFAARNIPSTPDSRRAYREMFFTTPGIEAFISGVILQDETIRQKTSAGVAMPDLLAQRGIVPGIKVDAGVKPLAGSTGEFVTEGLDGLRDRLREYRGMGARFTKWRAVFTIGDGLPSIASIKTNAHMLARYAAICQEQGVVPIVEPEVLMDGSHSIDRCEEVTGDVLHAVFDALFDQHVSLDGMLLKPNMVMAGAQCPVQPDAESIATATLRCLARHVPAAVHGVVFLSGGQSPVAATEHLEAINRRAPHGPWTLTFSYGRALQDEALDAWGGVDDRIGAGQLAFYHRAKCDGAAALGHDTAALEGSPAGEPRAQAGMRS